jgi:hypothetical protein
MIIPEGAIVIHPGNQAFNIIMKEYPLRYHLSDERATEYYQTDNILIPPRMTDKYYTGINKRLYTFKKHPLAPGTWTLCHTRPGNLEIDMSQGDKGRVIANPVAAGMELTKPINGQTIWQGQPWERHKIKHTLMDYFTPRIIQQLPQSIVPPKGQYLQLQFLFFVPFGAYRQPKEDAKRVAIQDIDNHAYPYVKVFIDTLQYLNVLKGDDYRYFRGYYTHYVEIAADQKHYLEVKFHFCTNTEIIMKKMYHLPEINAGIPVNEVPTLIRQDGFTNA